MRRALRVLIPAALISSLGLGVLAFTGELNLLRVDLTSLLRWGDAPQQDGTPGLAATPPAAPATNGSGSDSSSPSLGETPDKAAALSPGAPPSAAPSRLKIEFARINADGASVIGGRAPPGSRVSLHANNEVVATVDASPDGQWSAIVARAFPPGPLALRVTTDAGDSAAATSPTVTVEVAKGSDRVELAVAAPTVRPILPPRAPEAEQRAINDFAAMIERARSSAADGSGAKPEASVVPVPITFDSGEATMTPQGARAAHLLAEYVRIMKPHTITLSGHADVRGSEDYNFDLSRRRLETIRSFLRRYGYTGELDLLARGKTQPYEGIDRSKASRDEIYQADRRVELRLAE